jgi:hypothetical protein
MHYGGGIEWVDPQAVRELGQRNPRGTLVLEVRSWETEELGDNRYRIFYLCAFLSLEPCRPCTGN